MSLVGRSILGFRRGAPGGRTFRGRNPRTGKGLDPEYHEALPGEVEEACELADRAFPAYASTTGSQRSCFLRAIAQHLRDRTEDFVAITGAETALPAARIRLETERACRQFCMFADTVEEGSWVDAAVDHGDSSRTPTPKPDVRSFVRPLGPVAVFGASNFPIAFSVAGGDTASALAAGNPVIAYAHFAHPGTAELAGTAIMQAAKESHLPEGVFALLFAAGHEVGAALVKHPLVRAVAFTGSREGGRALMDLAASRAHPVPVYAEMGSVNPVVLFPGALRERSSGIAEALHASINLGVGQFCTCPGVIFVNDCAEGASFTQELAKLMEGTPPRAVVHAGIRERYEKALARLQTEAHVKALVRTHVDPGPGCCLVAPALFETEAAYFPDSKVLGEEVFGPCAICVNFSTDGELMACLRSLEGQLTATIHGTERELEGYRAVISLLERKAGRVIFNGVPTGVEVCPAMVHGGPCPATSDGRSTSVGVRAMRRFTRLVCYQDFPEAALPPALKEANPLGIKRTVDGQVTRDR